MERIAAKQPALTGASRTFAIESASAMRQFTLVAVPGKAYYPDDTFDRVFMAVRIPSTIVFALAAILLVMRLPGSMSWGLALFLLTLRPARIGQSLWIRLLLSRQAAGSRSAARTVSIDTFGYVGIIAFALLFPSGEAQGKDGALLRSRRVAVSIAAAAGARYCSSTIT